ncbi:thioredoxin domain-containing protein [Muriicola soli]|uniref:Thioredoxin domain-containing protein n=1 Tax=Muriicola soli TaxID=2507538 RepID=A0A411E6L6_9FLAO|nr:thioredoxin domain-containing protein [Muriicola soli]QBA63329.1 thioredoxin domain-containing protein [Muriicola soli]
MKTNPEHTNALIHETSPYLLQHAHNPVNWYAWKPEVLLEAKKENKLLLISIGYAACHWCHVMETECFEDEEVAAVMNRHFVNIKIDREERPDIDHIYMDALQMMTGSGGWPLNIVALPDGRPFWGATYVRKTDWTKVLEQLATLYSTDKTKVLEYAAQMEEGLHSINIIPAPEREGSLSQNDLKSAVKNWSQYFDTYLGGYKRAPKFMMPVNLNFLLHFTSLFKDSETNEYVHTTLRRIAYGGIYDHLGGGFSRYAVDTKWHVPHFEKMLYDNAQMISLYAKAYASNKNPLYKRVVEESIVFVNRELKCANGGYYASLDADSTNEQGHLKEGAYYVWTEKELTEILQEDFPLFRDYYNINSYGHWEEDFYVLIRDHADEEIAQKHNLKTSDFISRLKKCKKALLSKRELRARPGLDDKILTSWNALMIKALAEAYRYLGEQEYLDQATEALTFIENSIMKGDGSLFHNHKEGKSSIEGFLEDYANLIAAYLEIYELSFEESWAKKAKQLSDYCVLHFWDKKSGLFYFTSDTEEITVRRSFETTDNVIPASNSVMALNLYKLALLYPEGKYGELAERMLQQMKESILEHPNSHAHWMHFALFQVFPFKEVVITGESALEYAKVIASEYLPNTLFAGAVKEGGLSLLKGRIKHDKTLIYICQNGACQLPVATAEEALASL